MKKEEVLKENTESPKEEAKGDAAKENPLQKELEAKKQDNLELTVGGFAGRWTKMELG